NGQFVDGDGTELVEAGGAFHGSFGFSIVLGRAYQENRRMHENPTQSRWPRKGTKIIALRTRNRIGARLVPSRSGGGGGSALGCSVARWNCRPAAEWDTPRSLGHGARHVPGRSGSDRRRTGAVTHAPRNSSARCGLRQSALRIILAGPSARP